MKIQVNSLISIPGWMKEEWKEGELSDEEFEYRNRLVSWERSLDVYFTKKMNREELVQSSPLCGNTLDFPEWISWRELVGMRFLRLDISFLRLELSPETRSSLLPTICLSLAIWGKEPLGGFGEELEVFLTPRDHVLISEELTGYGDPFEDEEPFFKDEKFYGCLDLLTKEQRNCIAEFIEFYFCMYKSSFPGFTERRRMASEELVKIWRGE